MLFRILFVLVDLELIRSFKGYSWDTDLYTICIDTPCTEFWNRLCTWRRTNMVGILEANIMIVERDLDFSVEVKTIIE